MECISSDFLCIYWSGDSEANMFLGPMGLQESGPFSLVGCLPKSRVARYSSICPLRRKGRFEKLMWG